MKRFFKNFCLRGLMVSGIGPIVYGIVILIIHLCGVNVSFNGAEVFKGILSTYLIAFVAAGITSIHQEEKLGIGLNLLIHGLILYICYLAMYLINGWLPENLGSILAFSIIFIVTFVVIALIVYIVEKLKSKKLNKQLNNK